MGGEVSPFRLVRLSAEELLSKDISEWRKPDATQVSASFSINYTPSTGELVVNQVYRVYCCPLRNIRPVQGSIQDSPNWAAGVNLAHIAWILMMLHQHLMQMYVSLPLLPLLTWSLLQ